MRDRIATTYGQYRVTPFSLWDGRHHRLSPGIREGCAICCRPVMVGQARHFALVLREGERLYWGSVPVAENDPGYVGYYPVGFTCHGRFWMYRATCPECLSPLSVCETFEGVVKICPACSWSVVVG